ncbi:MAG: hypothetical protein ACOC6E_02335 [Thermodesulfobacteriota bacterium]
MEDHEITQQSYDRLAKALRPISGTGAITSQLSQVLACASQKDTVSYQEIKAIIEDDPGDLLLLADECRLLLSVSTAKSSSWEDRLLLLKEGERYEIPNIIRYVVKKGIHSGRWDARKAVESLFKDLEDPYWKTVPELVRSIQEEAVNHVISSNQIKMICLQFGLSNRVDSLIAELKAAGIISPRLASTPEVNRHGAPLYELNPSVPMGGSK